MLRRLILLLAVLLAAPAAANTNTVTIDGVSVNRYCILLLMGLTESRPADEEIYRKLRYVPLSFCEKIQLKRGEENCRVKYCRDGTERNSLVRLTWIPAEVRAAVFLANYGYGGPGVASDVAGIALGRRVFGNSVEPVLELRWLQKNDYLAAEFAFAPWSNSKRVTLSIFLEDWEMLRVMSDKADPTKFIDMRVFNDCCGAILDQDIDPFTGQRTQRRYRIHPAFVRDVVSLPDSGWRRCFIDLLESEGVLVEMDRTQGASPSYTPAQFRALGQRFLKRCG